MVLNQLEQLVIYLTFNRIMGDNEIKVYFYIEAYIYAYIYIYIHFLKRRISVNSQ